MSCVASAAAPESPAPPESLHATDDSTTHAMIPPRACITIIIRSQVTSYVSDSTVDDGGLEVRGGGSLSRVEVAIWPYRQPLPQRLVPMNWVARRLPRTPAIPTWFASCARTAR